MSRTAALIAISAKMRQEFKRHAPAALARRNDAYLVSVALNVAQWLLIGGLGLTGLHGWGWSPGEMLLVFVAGIVASIAADSVKWIFAHATMRAEYRKMENDRLVWAMLDAYGRQADAIAADRLQPKAPGPALILDLALGALGAWWLSAHLAAFGLDANAWSSLNPGVRLALIVVFAAPLLSMLAATLAHRRAEGGYDDLEFRAGGRGIGLILLAGALAFSGDGEEGARNTMQFIHWATVVAGVMSIAGVAIMVWERSALREWLAADAAASGPASEPSNGRHRRRRRKPR